MNKQIKVSECTACGLTMRSERYKCQRCGFLILSKVLCCLEYHFHPSCLDKGYVQEKDLGEDKK